MAGTLISQVDSKRTFRKVEFRFFQELVRIDKEIYILVFDVALARLKKNAVYYCNHYSSPEQSIKDFFSGSTGNGKVLVTSFELIKGHEYPIIIDTAMDYEISSRSSSKLVRTKSNQLLDLMNVYEGLLKDEQHECQNMMKRESRPKINLNVIAFIGECSNHT